MDYELVEVGSEEDWRAYHGIRRRILWEGRGRSGYDEKYKDEYLPNNHPLLLKLNGAPLGTTRLDDMKNGNGIVRMVAIEEGFQRQGHGRKLSHMVEDYARRKNIKTLFVNAAPGAIGYYEKLGWHSFSWDQAELAGVAADCVQMRKFL